MLYKWYHLWVFGINMKLHQIVVVKHFLMSVTEENRGELLVGHQVSGVLV